MLEPEKAASQLTSTELSWVQDGANGVNFKHNWDYLFTIESGTYKAYSGTTGIVAYSDSSFDSVYSSVMSALGSTQAVLQFASGTFTTTNGLAISRGNICLRGMGKGVSIIQGSTSLSDASAIIYALPNNTATNYNLTTNAGAGSTFINVDATAATNISVNDYVLLSSSSVIDTEFPTRTQGELHRVLTVNATTGRIDFGTTNNGTHVFEAYTTANLARLQVLSSFLENISLENLTVTDSASSRTSALSNGQTAWRYIRDLTIKDCQFRNMFYSGIQLFQTWNTTISGCEFRDLKDVTPAQNTYYGIEVRGATVNTTVVNCVFDNMRHGVTQGAGGSGVLAGRTRNLTITGNTFRATTTSHIDCHQGAYNVVISNNTCVGDDTSANSIQARSPSVITGNTVYGVLGKGIYLFGAAGGSVVSNNYIYGCSSGIYVSDYGVDNLTITGNTITQTGSGYPIHFDVSGTANSGHDSVIANNSIYQNAVTTYGIVLDGSSNVLITGNKMKMSTAVRFLTTNTTGTSVVIAGNYWTGLGGTPIQNLSASATHIVMNNFGYNMKGNSGSSVTTPLPASTGNVLNSTGAQSTATSGAVYTNTQSPKIFQVTGGTVATIAINGVVVGTTSGNFLLGLGETISITHSSAPTVAVKIA